MSLDGLRAWIGVLERKLTMRTRVFLVLVAIAVGGAAAGIYLAVEAQNDAVSESDLQTVRDELTGGAPAAASPELTQLEAELETLQGEVATLRSESGSSGEGSGGTKTPGGDAESQNGGATAAPPNQPQLKREGEEAIEKAGK